MISQDKLITIGGGRDVQMTDDTSASASILAFEVSQVDINLEFLGILLGSLNNISEVDDF